MLKMVDEDNEYGYKLLEGSEIKLETIKKKLDESTEKCCILETNYFNEKKKTTKLKELLSRREKTIGDLKKELLIKNKRYEKSMN